MNITVIYGGGSSEDASSYKSATSIFSSLQNNGHQANLLELTSCICGDLTAQKPDHVFIAAQGLKCGDGTLQAILDRMGIGYTGSGMQASAVCNDKILCKKLMDLENIRNPRYTTLLAHEDAAHKLTETIGFPCVVKAPHEGSSYGLDFVDSVEEIDKIPPLFAFESRLLAEERIKGIDLTLPMLEENGEIIFLPLIEIKPKNGLNTTFSKFSPGQISYVEAKVDAAVEQEAKQFSKALFEAVGCRGYARVDMILGNDGLYVLEINGVPGLSDVSIFPTAAQIYGISKDELIERILNNSY